MPEAWDLKRVLTPSGGILRAQGTNHLVGPFSSFPKTLQSQSIQETVRTFTFLATEHNLLPFKQEFSQEVFCA